METKLIIFKQTSHRARIIMLERNSLALLVSVVKSHFSSWLSSSSWGQPSRSCPLAVSGLVLHARSSPHCTWHCCDLSCLVMTRWAASSSCATPEPRRELLHCWGHRPLLGKCGRQRIGLASSPGIKEATFPAVFLAIY